MRKSIYLTGMHMIQIPSFLSMVNTIAKRKILNLIHEIFLNKTISWLSAKI